MIHLKVEDAAVIPLSVDSSPAVPMTVTEAFIEGGSANLMPNKDATASTSQVVVQPDAGYDGMEKVTIEAVPEGELGVPVISLMTVLGAPTINARCEVENGGFLETGAYTAKGVSPASILPTQAGTTITPTTSEQTAVDEYKWVTGKIKVAPIPSEYIVPSGTKNITENGNAQDVKAYEKVNVSVPNSYSASDEGKVVSNGALVAQSSQNIDTNGTYDTTLKNEVVVNVSGGGGGLATIITAASSATNFREAREIVFADIVAPYYSVALLTNKTTDNFPNNQCVEVAGRGVETGANSGIRYKNGSFQGVYPASTTYDAVIEVGDEFIVVTAQIYEP